MQRSTTFLMALFVVAVVAAAAIKFQFSAQRPNLLGRSVPVDAAQSDRSAQVSAGRSTGVALSAAQGNSDQRGSVNEAASPMSGRDASAGPVPGNSMRQSDLEVRATRDASLVVRFRAVQGLSDYASSSAVQTLSNVLLTDQAPRVRLAAVQSLADIAKANPDLDAEVRAALQTVVYDSNGNVSVASRHAISELQ